MKDLKRRLGSLIVTTGLAFSLLSTPVLAYAKQVDNTAGVVASSSCSIQVNNINYYGIRFQNKELEQIIGDILKGPITKENLLKITDLKIDRAMQDSNLSDLKYLNNLERLTILNNDVDCANLSENTNLNTLVIKKGNIVNTSYLPRNLAYLNLYQVSVSDGILNAPDNLSIMALTSTVFKGLNFNNPSKLGYFYYNGYEFLDLNWISECSNLEKVVIRRSPNVVNGQVLGSFKKVSLMSLDEQATLWLDSKTLENIPLSNESIKKHLLEVIKKLDSVYVLLNMEGKSDKEKIDTIISYIISLLEYDDNVYDEIPYSEVLANYYNDYPLSSSLNENIGVCVNYACLFKALANRGGLDNYQLSNLSHTWNMVKLANETSYKAYDVTYLDRDFSVLGSFDKGNNYVKTLDRKKSSLDYIKMGKGESLYYYKFDLGSIPEYANYKNSLLLLSGIDGVSLDEVVFDDDMISLLMGSYTLLLGLIGNLVNKLKNSRNANILRKRR